MKISNELWSKFPMELRQRFWKETNYNTQPPSNELLKETEDAKTLAYLTIPVPDGDEV